MESFHFDIEIANKTTQVQIPIILIGSIEGFVSLIHDDKKKYSKFHFQFNYVIDSMFNVHSEYSVASRCHIFV